MYKVTMVCDFALPAIMLLCGLLFLLSVPRKANALCGYRTHLSVRTKETWHFAHRYFGRLWLIFGAVELGATIAAVSVLLQTGGEEKLENWSLLLIVLQLVFLLIPVAPTERALRREFDRYGCPITERAKRLSRDDRPAQKTSPKAPQPDDDTPAELPHDEETDYGPEADE